MSVEKILCDLLAFILGIFYLFASLLGVFGTSPKLGTFGARFSYELQEIMGGLLGVPNYMMVESVYLVVVSWGCLKCISFPPPTDHMPGISLVLALAYGVIVLVYGVISGVSVLYFVPVFLLTVGEASWRFTRFLDGHAIKPVVIVAIGAGALCLMAIYRMARRKNERRLVNEQFLRKLQYLHKNSGTVWKQGKDAPEGFDEADAADLISS